MSEENKADVLSEVPVQTEVQSPGHDVDKLTDFVLGIIGGSELSSLNLLGVCVSLMQVVEKYPKLQGVQKKDLVVRTLQRVIEKNGGSVDILALVPSFIDLAVSIDRKKVKIAVEQGCFKIFGCGKK